MTKNLLFAAKFIALVLFMPLTSLAQGNSYAYITNASDNSVSVVNTSTDVVTTTIAVGAGPQGVAFSPDGSKAYITNNGTNTVSVINTSTNAVSATVTVGNAPLGAVVTPDGSKVYVANTNSNSVSVIAAATNTVVATIPVEVSPLGVAVAPDGSMVYVANAGSNTVSVINSSTDAIIATVSFPISSTPFGVTVSPDGTKLYVALQTSNKLSVVNTATNTIAATINVGNDPLGVAVTGDGSKVYVTNQGGNTVSVINTGSNTVTNTVAVGASPTGVSITPDGTKAYVANVGSNNVSIINTATNTVTGTFPVGSAPVAFGNFTAILPFPLPVHFTSFIAEELPGHHIELRWTVADESNGTRYDVERSTDATRFSRQTSINKNNVNASSYSWTDAAPDGTDYYRIKSVEASGKILYSQVLKVALVKGSSKISIYPNPIKGNSLNLEIIDQPKGIYTIELRNFLGQMAFKTAITYNGGSLSQTINLPVKYAKGIYQLCVTNGTVKHAIKLVIE